MVKNILWKYNLYICNIDWVRSCQRLKYGEIIGRNQTLILVISYFWDFSLDFTERDTIYILASCAFFGFVVQDKLHYCCSSIFMNLYSA